MEGDDVGGQTLDPVLNKVYDTMLSQNMIVATKLDLNLLNLRR